MLENLESLVQEKASESIINNPAVPNEQNGAAVQQASSSIMEVLQQSVASGNIKGVLDMFHSDTPEQTEVGAQIQNNFAGGLTDKLGIGQGANIAGSLIPNILKSLVNRTNYPNNSSFSLPGILASLAGGNGKGFDFGTIVNKYKSGAFDKDGDGDTDLSDVKAIFSGGNFMDTLKGLFK